MLPGGEIFLNVAPMFHIWGLAYATWVPIFAQSTLVMVPRYDPDKVVQALAAYKVTIFGGGPAPIYMGLLASPLFDDADLSSLIIASRAVRRVPRICTASGMSARDALCSRAGGCPKERRFA